MLRLIRLEGIAKWRVLAATFAGVLIVSLSGGCSAVDRSDAAAVDPMGAGDRPPVPDATIGDDLGLSLLRRLPDLLDDAAGRGDGRLGGDDGYIPDGTSQSPFAMDDPAIAYLAPALRDAVQLATIDARDDGIEVRITSGWRSAEYQQVLLDEAVSRYGSREEARRYVNTPGQSTHVTGNAVDIGPTDAAYWMSQYGASYGLCQTYANEIWHYELMIEPGAMCPEPLPDASAG